MNISTFIGVAVSEPMGVLENVFIIDAAPDVEPISFAVIDLVESRLSQGPISPSENESIARAEKGAVLKRLLLLNDDIWRRGFRHNDVETRAMLKGIFPRLNAYSPTNFVSGCCTHSFRYHGGAESLIRREILYTAGRWKSISAQGSLFVIAAHSELAGAIAQNQNRYASIDANCDQSEKRYQILCSLAEIGTLAALAFAGVFFSFPPRNRRDIAVTLGAYGCVTLCTVVLGHLIINLSENTAVSSCFGASATR